MLLLTFFVLQELYEDMEQDIPRFCPPHTSAKSDPSGDSQALSITIAAVDLDELVREIRADPDTPCAVLSPGEFSLRIAD